MLVNRRSVLHVDDDPLITDLVGQHLKLSGFESEAVHDPTEAMKQLVRGQHRIALVDVHMPKLSGLQLLEEIKRVDAGVRVILLTALVQEATVVEAMRLGAEACFFKPLDDPQLMLDAIEDAYEQNDRWWRTLSDLSTRRKASSEEPSQVVVPR